MSADPFTPIVHSTCRLFPHYQHLSFPDGNWSRVEIATINYFRFVETYEFLAKQFPYLSVDCLLGAAEKVHLVG